MKFGESIPRFRPGRYTPLLVAVSAAAVVLGVWYLRVVADAVTVNTRDPLKYFYPMQAVGFSELAAGRLFLWNPYQAGGAPGLATAASGFLYPFNAPYLLFPAATAMELVTQFHLALCIVFTAVAARAFGLGWWPGLIGGCVYAFSYPLSMLFFPNAPAALAWFPLGIAALQHSITRGDSRWLPVLSFAAAMPWLTSAPQSGTYMWGAWGIVAVLLLAELARNRGTIRDPVVMALKLALAMGAAALCAAPQLLPMLELTGESVRGAESFAAETVLSYPRSGGLETLLKSVVPSPFFRVDFVGAIPVALACAGLCRRRLGMQAFCLVLVTWGAIGLAAPHWYIAAMSVFPVGAFRVPSRVVFVANLGLALLAALGVTWLTDPYSSLRQRRRMAVVLAVAGVVLAFLRFPHPTWWIPAMAVPLAALTLRQATPARSGLVLAGLLGLVLVDFVGSSRNTDRLPYVNDEWKKVHGNTAMFEAVRERAGYYRTVRAQSLNFQLDRVTKAYMLNRVYSVEDHEPLALQAYDDFFRYATLRRTDVGLTPLPWSGMIPGDFLFKGDPLRLRFLNLLSVRYFVVPEVWLFSQEFREFRKAMPKVPVEPGVFPADASEIVLENRQALPRAYGVFRAECIPDRDGQLVRLGDPAFDPTRSVVLQDGCSDESPTGGRMPRVEIVSYEPTEVRLRADFDYPGWLVLTDSFYPGWQAEVNGQPAAVQRANTVVRAVRVPDGESEVVFRFVPWSFHLGLILAGTAISSWALWVLIRRRFEPIPQAPANRHE